MQSVANCILKNNYLKWHLGLKKRDLNHALLFKGFVNLIWRFEL